MAVRLPALGSCRPLPPGRFLVLISLIGSVDPQGHSATERIRSTEKFYDLIGNRIRDLPACSIVSQPSTLRRGPIWKCSSQKSALSWQLWNRAFYMRNFRRNLRFSHRSVLKVWVHWDVTACILVDKRKRLEAAGSFKTLARVYHIT
jgi:hypothetical protein